MPNEVLLLWIEIQETVVILAGPVVLVVGAASVVALLVMALLTLIFRLLKR